MIWWNEPGYLVAFTTRAGGVSDPPYDSLNLTTGTGDSLQRVEQNRRLACEAMGLPADRLAVNRQVHSPTINRAFPGRRREPGDGLWTDEAQLPMLAMSADCLPIAVAVTAAGVRWPCCTPAGAGCRKASSRPAWPRSATARRRR